METQLKIIKVQEIVENYSDDGEENVFAYNNQLIVRPTYHRDFVYTEKQRNAVIEAIFSGLPIRVMYWIKAGENRDEKSGNASYELIDGQQRLISICQYCNDGFSVRLGGNDRFFHNLLDIEKERILNYELAVVICEGEEAEKRSWFRVINFPGAAMTNQEYLNAVYVGPWVSDAKRYFGRKDCPAEKLGAGFMKGNPVRMDYLEKILNWIADRDGLESGAIYMASHQEYADANELWLYYQEVIAWARRLFPDVNRKLTESQEWGYLYNKYRGRTYNSNVLKEEIERFSMDDEVTKKQGIIPYLWSERTPADEKTLCLRSFTEAQKMRAYEAQDHHCAGCIRNGIDVEYRLEELEGEPVIPWRRGGRTTDDNLRLVCRKCKFETIM